MTWIDISVSARALWEPKPLASEYLNYYLDFFFSIWCYASEPLQTLSLIDPNSFWCAVGFNKEANTFTPKLFVRKTKGRDVEGDDMEWGLGA